MIPLTLAEIAAAVDGRLDGGDPAARVTGTVEFDSRKVTPGGLFVAFPGEKVDGHDYAEAAVAAGAVAVLASRPVPVPAVLVDDQLDAMAALARYVVDRLPSLVVVGLTGSSGKTTTKDLVAQLLTRLGPTVAPAGSFNNELGHPYTVLRADEETRFLVLEMGARGLGHITHLSAVAPPRVGVVINVGVAHIGEFGSVDAIAQAKGELVEALPADGVAVLNADDPRVRAMAARTTARVVLAGEAPDASVRAVDVVMEAGRATYTLVTPDGQAPVRLGIAGRHQVGNTLLAAAVAHSLGYPVAELGPPCRSCGWSPPAGWTSSTVPTVSRSSTTRTTPTPPRWRPRCTRWSVPGRAAARWRCWATWPSWASTRGKATRRSAGSPRSSASTG
ncbi:hypothetical protein Pflav_003010 [Phytohabitans flavus]|uniref:UDP-N-acetylmuramoyl-tripeptide--D-alanyl-D-alanine ligase n=1 Tax=Phytohabitans flavus TaxID=1076124 RepID=A0A6F8XJC2_9ACTN|nr:hypothetical protein Pflav_003010 [Phytohabitans flavus]